MTQPTPNPSQEGSLTMGLAPALLAFAWLAAAGCQTAPAARPEKPLEVVLFVKADRTRWQKSGLWVNVGDVVHCVAEGKWSDHHGSYGPEGNPEIIKDHLGLKAPANALLMKIDYHTNIYLRAQVVLVGKETNVVAKGTGPLLFANNISLTTGNYGEIKVTVTMAPDTDEDGISDYDEITVWKTDPTHTDSDGDRFPDAKEVSERKADARKKTPTPLP